MEISLQTVEGDKMILEVWSLSINTELCDPALKATYSIYNRMGLMLKSLVSVTRITPAYKYSRRQKESDSYNIYYRIYVGEPQIHHLGEFYFPFMEKYLIFNYFMGFSHKIQKISCLTEKPIKSNILLEKPHISFQTCIFPTKNK